VNDAPMRRRIEQVLVLGGGSAGFLTASTLKHRLPRLRVTVLRSKEIGIIGVGEGTTVVLPQHLHDYLQVDLAEFYRQAEPQWKLGIRFLWGKRPYFDYAFHVQLDTKYDLLPKVTAWYCQDRWDDVGIPTALMSAGKVFLRDARASPVITPALGYHIENEKFVSFLEGLARRLGVEVVDDTVAEVVQDEHGVSLLRLASGQTAAADLYADCSGFASLLAGETLAEPSVSFRSSLFNDRAVVGGWQRTDESIKPYTTAETMAAGWCWQIEHETRINRGYVYSSDFASDEEADRDFRQLNPKVEATRIVKFRAGRFQRGWIKNVVAIGNSSGFVEPLEATSLGVIAVQCRSMAETIVECDGLVHSSAVALYNQGNARTWDAVRRFLAIHFKFNDRLDTPYWRACREMADLAGGEEIVEYYRDMGPSVLCRKILLDPLDQFGMEGYLSLLVGQQVPHQGAYQPSAEEWNNWRRIQEAIQRQVAGALTVREALATVRSPAWKWPSVYRQGV